MKQKKILSLLPLFVVSFFGVFAFIHVVSADPSDYAGGDGSPGDPYQITTCAGLQEIRDSLSAHYILTQNIDCSDTVNWNEGAGFVPIGTNGNPFQGTLNGQGYEVTGLTINNPIAGDTAIFGSIGSGGVVEYVDFINIDITDPDGTAASIAYDLKSGGIVRYVSVSGSVTAASAAGMVNVIRIGAELYDSYVLNMTLASRFESAGIALDVREDSSIARTYAVATHTAIEPFTPETQSGIANYNSGAISSSFYDITVSGAISDGFGTSKTTAEMQTTSTFTNAGWDFDDVWDIDGSYPFLRAPEAPQPVEFAGGDGSSEDPYQIETCEQLQKIDENLSAHLTIF